MPDNAQLTDDERRAEEVYDRLIARGYHDGALHCRSLPAWQALLHACGYSSAVVAAPGRGSFANILLLARPRTSGHSN